MFRVTDNFKRSPEGCKIQDAPAQYINRSGRMLCQGLTMCRAVSRRKSIKIWKGELNMSVDIGIDLGTASVLVYVHGKGVVLKEPSVVAFDRDTNEIKAIGEEARLMLGRTPGNMLAVRPLRQGCDLGLYGH